MEVLLVRGWDPRPSPAVHREARRACLPPPARQTRGLCENAIATYSGKPESYAPGCTGDSVLQHDDGRHDPGDHRRVIGLGGSFLLANGALIVTQAAQVALPGRGVPEPFTRLRAGRPALLVPGLVLAFVAAGTLGPGVATALSRVALGAVP